MNIINSKKKTIIFAPGLNTYPDGQARIGPWILGSMTDPWVTALKKSHEKVIALPHIGREGLHTAAKNAIRQLESEHLNSAAVIGHSAGGLIGRALASRFPDKITSVVTVGTPHNGAYAAELMGSLNEGTSLLSKTAKLLSYDPSLRGTAYASLARMKVCEFNKIYSLDPRCKIAFVGCSATQASLGLPFRLLHLLIPELRLMNKNDGFVELDSQKFGHCLANLNLDHFAQIGYFLQAKRLERKKSEQAFCDLVETVRNFIESQVEA